MALLWAQAERLNRSAYAEWNAEQALPVPHDASIDFAAACREWSAQPERLLALLRALPYPEVAVSLLPVDVVIRLGDELAVLADASDLPDFVVTDDPADTRRLWLKLIVLVVVATDPDVDIANSVQWLLQHPPASLQALHAIRLFDWTIVADLARACASLSHPNRPEAPTTGADRI
ncbi:hypothetical protein P43SY_011563 [Pythium insidiosum]|uniref:Uncharacterized protein n=1 Tax=Pythium insidiosum TaxID=114742 RepID=A0AAD5L8X4_PYTIN|nr:hypothetical protein P43SY_011563 [Pythium insidiosum]